VNRHLLKVIASWSRLVARDRLAAPFSRFHGALKIASGNQASGTSVYREMRRCTSKNGLFIRWEMHVILRFPVSRIRTCHVPESVCQLGELCCWNYPQNGPRFLKLDLAILALAAWSAARRNRAAIIISRFPRSGMTVTARAIPKHRNRVIRSWDDLLLTTATSRQA